MAANMVRIFIGFLSLDVGWLYSLWRRHLQTALHRRIPDGTAEVGALQQDWPRGLCSHAPIGFTEYF
jgi:hypothetical protein